MDQATISAAIQSIMKANYNMGLNKQASTMHFGGKLSPVGHKHIAEESEKDGMDLYRAHHMVGLGQTVVPGV
jgi:hypothetical protein